VRISIITAAGPEHARYLCEAWGSIASQVVHPAGAPQLEWCLQLDGEHATPPSLPPDPRIRLEANADALGPSTSRNLALLRATGGWALPLDADDLLEPGALGRYVAALRAYPTARWIAGPVLDLLPGGGTVRHDVPHEPGPVEAGWFADHVRRTGAAPWHGATGLLEVGLLRSVGGWPALPHAEDVAMWCATTSIAPGVVRAEPVARYRGSEGEVTRSGRLARAARWLPAVLQQADALRGGGSGRSRSPG
jgi:hypothetical protein